MQSISQKDLNSITFKMTLQLRKMDLDKALAEINRAIADAQRMALMLGNLATKEWADALSKTWAVYRGLQSGDEKSDAEGGIIPGGLSGMSDSVGDNSR